MTDFIAKKYISGYDLHDPTDSEAAPIHLPIGPVSSEWVIEWLQKELGFDIAVEDGEGWPAGSVDV